MELAALFASKYLWAFLGPVAVIAVVWFKAYTTGKSFERENQEEVERQIQARLRAIEAKNQFLEKKRETTNDQVDKSSGSVDELLSVFNKLQSEETPDSSSDPKTK